MAGRTSESAGGHEDASEVRSTQVGVFHQTEE